MRSTRRVKKILTNIIFIILLNTFTHSLEVPKLNLKVNDFAGVLTNTQRNELTGLLVNTEQQTSCQVVLLIIKALEGESLEDYSLNVVEKNLIGQKEFDNGVLLLVAMSEKKIRIEVGYGLEGIITDIKSGYIIRELIVPSFKNGDFYTGIKTGLLAITGLITGGFEITPEELAKYKKKSSPSQLPVGLIVFFIIIFFGIIKNIIRGGRHRKPGSSFLTGAILGGLLGSSMRSGRSSSFFSSGGGFSGGGGSFGGGGASGGW